MPVISRRAFLAVSVRGLSAVAILAPTTGYAQTLAKAARVGLLMTTTPVAASHIVVAFADSLRAFGYFEGKNLTLEYRWAEGRPERLDELVADLIRQRVDVIVASSQAAALAAKRATRAIPIVMVNATDPVESGLVASLARPGGNVTGLSQQITPEIRRKQLQLVKELLPKASRVAVLRSRATTVDLQDYETAGRMLEIQVQLVNVGDRDDLKRAFAAIARDRVNSVIVPADPFLFTERQRVAELAREHRLPTMCSTREGAEAGGLMAYCVRLSEQFRRAAIYVDKVLRGASPATLPVESPSQYELVINLKTARALGLTIPPSLLLRADQVIE
jgi:putative tryptophan/tyrosine transport system substrate-binding protein